MVRILSFDPAIKNLTYSIVNVNKQDNTISLVSFDMFDIANGNKVKQCKFNDLMNNLIMCLKSIDLTEVDCVVIENQPSLKNPAVKSVSVCIYGFFKAKDMNVSFVSPNSKPKEIKECKTYKERKNKSIELGFSILCPIDKERVMKYKKQDDIMDSILQAVYFVKTFKA